jgi:uncharacterized protein involved in exopolysaccharide biosynthesis
MIRRMTAMTKFIEGWLTHMHAANAEIANLRAELDEVKSEGRQEVANIISNYRAAARRDAEEIARLRRTLEYYASFESLYGETARRALACRPQGERSET